MTIDRKSLKRSARDAMRLARPAPFWISLLATAIVMLLGGLGMSLDGTLASLRTMLAAAIQGGPVSYVAPVARGGTFGSILNAALEIMTAVVSVGFVVYAMRVWRRLSASAGNLFDGFGLFFRAVLIQILPSVLVGLWSLVYVVPVTGLVAATGHSWWMFAGLPLMIPALRAAYSYRLSVYIMLDRPDMGCWQCVVMSKQLMQGHKWELFVLELSFLGWYLLAAVIPIGGLLLMIWANVYQQVTFAGYYDAVAGVAPAEDIPPLDVPPAV